MAASVYISAQLAPRHSGRVLDHEESIILLGLTLFVFASLRRRNKAQPTWFQHLRGWQKVFGVVAAILALLIVLNPEFLALGFLGDAAFFEMLVLALSLQMHTFAAGAFRACAQALSQGVRWLGIPSPGLSYLLAVTTLGIGSAISAFQKAVQRFLS
jgi:hypothetical protein